MDLSRGLRQKLVAYADGCAGLPAIAENLSHRNGERGWRNKRVTDTEVALSSFFDQARFESLKQATQEQEISFIIQLDLQNDIQ
jgi:hypothetical protein